MIRPRSSSENKVCKYRSGVLTENARTGLYAGVFSGLIAAYLISVVAILALRESPAKHATNALAT